MVEVSQLLFSLQNAIENKQAVKIKYKDDKAFRIIEPFVVGSNKKQQFLVRCYDRSKRDWRLFLLSEIKALETANFTFPPYRAGYNRLDDCIIIKPIKRI